MNSDGNPAGSTSVATTVIVDFYSSSFCDPCIMTRAVLAEACALVASASVREWDVVRDAAAAETAAITVTPTVVVRAASGDEVFRAEGVPTLNQVLVALARAV